MLQQRSAHLLDTIANMTGLGAWELAVDSMTPLWSSHARQIFGLDPAGALTLDDILACYPEEAREVLAKAFREAIANGKNFDLTLPAIRTDGARLWVRCVGDAEVVDDRAVRLAGAIQDVTAQHAALPAPAAGGAFQLPGPLGVRFWHRSGLVFGGLPAIAGVSVPGAAGAGRNLSRRNLPWR